MKKGGKIQIVLISIIVLVNFYLKKFLSFVKIKMFPETAFQEIYKGF